MAKKLSKVEATGDVAPQDYSEQVERNGIAVEAPVQSGHELSHQELEQILANSFAVKARKLLHGVHLPTYSLTSQDTKRLLESHNAEASRILEWAEASVRSVVEAVQDCCRAGEYGNLAGAVECSKIDRLDTAQQIVRAWVTADELSRRHVQELTPIPGELAAEAEEVVEEVKADLERIGCGIDAMQADVHSATLTAERQFTHMARFRNLRSRAALALAADARVQLDAARAKQRQAAAGLDAAKKFLRDLAVRSIAAN